MTSVEGTLNDQPFQATLEPDGQRSHWLKVSRALRVAAGAEVGDTVTLEITPMAVEPEPSVPAYLRKALAANLAAKATWTDIKPVARRDWHKLLTSAGSPRARRPKPATAALPPPVTCSRPANAAPAVSTAPASTVKPSARQLRRADSRKLKHVARHAQRSGKPDGRDETLPLEPRRAARGGLPFSSLTSSAVEKRFRLGGNPF